MSLSHPSHCLSACALHSKILKTFKPGEYFGERALLHKETRAATITAKGKSVCLMLDADVFTGLVGKCGDILKRSQGKNYHDQDDDAE
eukprot:SAG31_NODE_636_length_13344_cov_8.492451_6_plen_88_part_00